MSDETPSIYPPKKDATDIPLAIVRSLVGAVPVVGGALNQWLSFAIAEPVAKRRDEWLAYLAQGLLDLRDKVEGLSPETLAESPIFVTVALNATQMAMRTHQAEKIEALRNAVLNAALGKAPGDDLTSIILNLVDRLTPLHLSILAVMRNPREHPVAQKLNVSIGGLDTVVRQALPSIKPGRELLDLVWKDLNDGGLLNGRSLHMTMSGNGLLEKGTTELGDRFLAFVSEPELPQRAPSKEG